MQGRGYRFLGGIGSTACKVSAPSWAQSVPTIAVLPISYSGSSTERAEYARLATESIRTEVAQHSGISLVDATPASQIDWMNRRPRTLGRYLGARSLLTGMLLRVGRRFRLDVQLTEANTGHAIVRNAYHTLDAVDTSVAAMSRGIAGDVIEALRAKVWTSAIAKPLEALTVYDHVIVGRSRLLRSAADNQAGRMHFRRAAELDPSCAEAWAGIGNAYAIDGLFGYTADFEPAPDTALEAVDHAAQLDPGNARTFWILGHVLSLRGAPGPALTAFAKSDILCQDDPLMLAMKATSLICAGEVSEALVTSARAMRQPNPSDTVLWNAAALSFHAGDYDRTISILEPIVARRPNFLRPRYHLCAAYAHCHRVEEASRTIAPVLAKDSLASVQNEFFKYRAIGVPPALMDHYLEGLTKAGLRS